MIVSSNLLWRSKNWCPSSSQLKVQCWKQTLVPGQALQQILWPWPLWSGYLLGIQGRGAQPTAAQWVALPSRSFHSSGVPYFTCIVFAFCEMPFRITRVTFLCLHIALFLTERSLPAPRLSSRWAPAVQPPVALWNLIMSASPQTHDWRHARSLFMLSDKFV